MKILVSGAGGLIGSAVVQILTARGDGVVALSRTPRHNAIVWPDGAVLEPRALEGFDAVIHLAGKSIAGRWTTAKKRAIYESRVERTRQLAEALSQTKSQPRIFLCASAIGIYGDRGDEELDESRKVGTGFLAQLCRDWENAGNAASEKMCVAHLRFGLVLDGDGGALKQMLPIFRLGLGGRLGDGHQYWSWVTLADAASAVVHVLDSELAGAFNITAPNPVTNAEFTRTLAATLRRPALFPVPKFALRLAMGDFADEGLLSSARVLPRHLLKSGFVFEHQKLDSALAEILDGR